jgi:Na+/proline symporter
MHVNAMPTVPTMMTTAVVTAAVMTTGMTATVVTTAVTAAVMAAAMMTTTMATTVTAAMTTTVAAVCHRAPRERECACHRSDVRQFPQHCLSSGIEKASSLPGIR